MSLIERRRFQTVVRMEESLLIQHNNNNKTHIEGKEKNTCYGHVLISLRFVVRKVSSKIPGLFCYEVTRFQCNESSDFGPEILEKFDGGNAT